MMRSSVVIFSAFLALIILKKKLYRHHYVSMALIVLGIFLGGLSQVLDSTGVKLSIAGVIIVFVAQLLGATGYVIEEKFLGDFDDLDPYLMAGIEGIWGFLLWMILLPIF